MTKEEEFLIKHGGGRLKDSYRLSEVKHLLNKTDLEPQKPTTIAVKDVVEKEVSVIKKGDVFIAQGGAKTRPHVVAKVMTEGSYVIPLTTTQDFYALCEYKSRFFKDGWISNQLLYMPNEYIHKHFVGILDDSRGLNRAIKMITQKLNRQKWY